MARANAPAKAAHAVTASMRGRALQATPAPAAANPKLALRQPLDEGGGRSSWAAAAAAAAATVGGGDGG